MGLLNSRNISQAKRLLDKNRHKVGGVVGKATDGLDKITKGKSSNLTAKVDDAARKFSQGSSSGVTNYGAHPDAVGDVPPPGGIDNRRQQDAAVAATNAMTSMANAATNFLNKAGVKLDRTEAHGSTPPDTADDPTTDDIGDRPTS